MTNFHIENYSAKFAPKDGRIERKELPDDSGRKHEKKELPDDSGRRVQTDRQKLELPVRMEPPIEISFRCPDNVDKKEFTRQLKGQERGLNSQTIGENIANREAYSKRLNETGDGRAKEGNEAQRIRREQAVASRIESNQKNGMSYSEARNEAKNWVSSMAALHNPDQIAGGDPGKVSRMGDARVNSSIGSQWRSRVDQLEKGISTFQRDQNIGGDALDMIKMNVKLKVA